jgi:hypothetical protein
MVLDMITEKAYMAQRSPFSPFFSPPIMAMRQEFKMDGKKLKLSHLPKFLSKKDIKIAYK